MQIGIKLFTIVCQNGAAVDSRLVPWDSVSVGQFRFVQRPGPANPLGRVKFLMHNPYAILIHDTNKRYTFDDGAGSSMSSGCVQAGAPDVLAEYLLTTVNGWEEGQARAAWQRGPRRGVRLDRPFLSQFTYFTTWAETDGSLRVYSDPYNYDARLAEALGLGPVREVTHADQAAGEGLAILDPDPGSEPVLDVGQTTAEGGRRAMEAVACAIDLALERGLAVEPAIMPEDRAGYRRELERGPRIFGAMRRSEYDMLKEAAMTAMVPYRS